MKTELVDLLKMSQDEIKQKALEISGAVELSDGNVFVEGTVPMVLVAHMDTVYTEEPKKIAVEGSKLYTPKGSRAGVGGDDRCGCYCLFTAAEWEFKPSLLFCSDEETVANASSSNLGCLDWHGYKCFIEIDGPGFGVFYAGSTSNKYLNEFMENEIGLTKLQTSFNDISNICLPGNPPGITLGAAYYNQHEANEEWISYFGLSVVVQTINQIINNLHKLEYSVLEESKSRAKRSIYFDKGSESSSNANEHNEIYDDLCSGNCFTCELFEECLNMEEDLCNGTGCFTCQMFDNCLDFVTRGGDCNEQAEYTTYQEGSKKENEERGGAKESLKENESRKA